MPGNFDELVRLMAHLRSPQGCAWDRQQTRKSYAKCIRDEAEELFRALDAEDVENIREEIGDLVWTLVFYSRLAEEEGLFTMDDALKGIREKIVRRHPHVFGDVKVGSVQEILDNWEAIKRKERSQGKKRSP